MIQTFRVAKDCEVDVGSLTLYFKAGDAVTITRAELPVTVFEIVVRDDPEAVSEFERYVWRDTALNVEVRGSSREQVVREAKGIVLNSLSLRKNPPAQIRLEIQEQMSEVTELHFEMTVSSSLGLLAEHDGTFWLVVPKRWWDLSTLIWWLFIPFDKKKCVKLTMANGSKVHCKAVRVATRYVRVRGIS
jgi:hypothetical protein